MLAILAAVVARWRAAAAWALSGPRAAVLGAGLYAAALARAAPGGVHGQRRAAGSAFAAGGVALGAWWRCARRSSCWPASSHASARWLKQSALDAALALVALVLLEAWRRRDWRAAVGGLLRLAAGAAIPLVLVLAQAAATGIGDWWFAVVGYRTGTESAISGDTGLRLTLLWESTHAALGDLAPLLLAVPGAVALHRARRLTLPALWLGAAAFGFLAGGLFDDHYWVQMIAPLSVCAAAGRTGRCSGAAHSSPRRWWRCSRCPWRCARPRSTGNRTRARSRCSRRRTRASSRPSTSGASCRPRPTRTTASTRSGPTPR